MKRGIILGVLVILLGMAMLVSAAVCGEPQEKSEVEVIVSTDKSVYEEGEDVKIFVIARNISAKKLTLTFGSSYMADYMIDDKYRWSDGKYFTLALEEIPLVENGTHTWTFVHKSEDYQLSPGGHKIVGGVVSVGEDSCMIEVISKDKIVSKMVD